MKQDIEQVFPEQVFSHWTIHHSDGESITAEAESEERRSECPPAPFVSLKSDGEILAQCEL